MTVIRSILKPPPEQLQPTERVHGSWSFVPNDGPTDSQPLTFTATDAYGAATFLTIDLIVNNVPPTTIFSNLTGEIRPGEMAMLAFSAQADPSSVDTDAGFLYGFDCTNDGIWEATNALSAAMPCTYSTYGVFTALGRISDKDNDYTDYTLTISMPNYAPIAVSDAAYTDEDTGVVIPVLANDSDPNGDALSIIGITTPLNGSAVSNGDNTITYTPHSGFSGTDSFSYTVSDGELSSTAMVTINVNPFVLTTPENYSSCVVTPTSDTFTIVGIGDHWLRGQVIVEFITGPTSRQLVPGRYYVVDHHGPMPFSLTVHYPPVTEWPSFIDPQTNKPIHLIHVDIQIEVYDAAGNPVREANGQVRTLGPDEEWDVFCRVVTTPTPVTPIAPPSVETPTLPPEAVIEEPVLVPSPETEEPPSQIVEEVMPTVTPEAP